MNDDAFSIIFGGLLNVTVVDLLYCFHRLNPERIGGDFKQEVQVLFSLLTSVWQLHLLDPRILTCYYSQLLHKSAGS